MLWSEEAYSGPDERPFQTLVKRDMTDRRVPNPLKRTVSPLVKTVPSYACCPGRLEAKSKLTISTDQQLDIYETLTCLTGSIQNVIWSHRNCRILGRKRHLYLFYIIILIGTTAIGLYTQRSAVSGALLAAQPNQNSRLCHIAKSHFIRALKVILESLQFLNEQPNTQDNWRLLLCEGAQN